MALLPEPPAEAQCDAASIGRSLQKIKDGAYGATSLDDPDLVARTGVKALEGKLPADTPKLNYTTPAGITKENVDKHLKPNTVF